MRLAGKQIYKKCFVVLICLLMFGNLAHGAVLCSGADGHIEIESAFHERCCDSAHSQPTEKNQLSYQLDCGKDKHCEPCVDIPIPIGLAKITRVSKQSNSNFSTPAINVIALAEQFNLSVNNSASSVIDAASYFAPLCAIILQI